MNKIYVTTNMNEFLSELNKTDLVPIKVKEEYTLYKKNEKREKEEFSKVGEVYYIVPRKLLHLHISKIREHILEELIPLQSLYPKCKLVIDTDKVHFSCEDENVRLEGNLKIIVLWNNDKQ